jgi:LPS export ABC transporter protein LptC
MFIAYHERACLNFPASGVPSAGHPGFGAAQPVIRLFSVWIVAAGCGAVFLPAPGVAQDAEGMVIHGLTFVASHGADRDLVLRAERAQLDPSSNVAHLERVESSVDPQEGTPGFEMTCDEGDLYLATNDFLAKGHVHGKTADGRRFTTTWVRYDHANGIASTDAPVEIEEAGGKYKGGGFRYQVRDQRFRLLGGASMVREP